MSAQCGSHTPACASNHLHRAVPLGCTCSTHKPAKVMSPVLQADLRAGRTTSDDEKLRVLASSILSAAARGASSYVKIHQLQQVCCQACAAAKWYTQCCGPMAGIFEALHAHGRCPRTVPHAPCCWTASFGGTAAASQQNSATCPERSLTP